MSSKYTKLFGIFLDCENNINLRNKFLEILDDNYSEIKNFVFPVESDNALVKKYPTLDVVLKEVDEYKASLTGSYTPWVMSSTDITFPYNDEDWEMSLYKTLNNIAESSKYVPDLGSGSEIYCLNIPWLLPHHLAERFNDWQLIKYCDIVLLSLSSIISEIRNRTTVEVVSSGDGESGSSVDIATNTEYNIGTSTTKVPNVHQVKNDIAQLQDQINDLESTSSDAYTNPNPSVITVGGLTSGTSFDNVPITEMFNKMLYPELYPTLTNPSFTFTENAPTLVEVGESFDVRFVATFNRGTINPAYGTDGYRAGLPTQYLYTGPQLPPSVASSALSNSQEITGYEFTAPGSSTWACRISYSAGDQPLGSTGGEYGTALAAGTTSSKSVTVTAVYPAYATTDSIKTLSKLPLTNGNYFEVTVAGEDDDVDKQTIQYALLSGNELTGVQFFNINSNKWEWLSGNAAASLNNFVASTATVNVNGVDTEYRKYVHNGPKTGERQMRFHT